MEHGHEHEHEHHVEHDCTKGTYINYICIINHFKLVHKDHD